MTDPIAENLALRNLNNATDEDNRRKLRMSGWWHSIDLGNGVITPGVRSINELQNLYQCFGLPADLRGKRVLDIGCWDGFFAFEAERHGAEVVGIDYFPRENFFEAHAALNSKVTFHEMSVYEITPEKLGTFDIVFFLGVLYHLEHPLLALQKICDLTRQTLIIESYVIDNTVSINRPVMEFYETDELGGQYDNWWGPNTDCLIRMTRAAGFVQANQIHQEAVRTVVRAERRFPFVDIAYHPEIAILDIFNAITFDHVYPRRGRRAYLQIWAQFPLLSVNRENVRVSIGAFDTLAIYIGTVENDNPLQQKIIINVAIPRGLAVGTYEVRIACDNFISPPFPIALTESIEW